MLRFGLTVAIVVLILDQITKWYVLEQVMRTPRIIEITGFFNIVMVWNPGISFGFLGGGGPWQPWLLAAFGTILAGGLVIWMYVSGMERLASLGVGLIVGGALGNVIDRLRFGAVFDFLDVHAGGWHWPAFNVADAAITLGVVALIVDAVLNERREKRIN